MEGNKYTLLGLTRLISKSIGNAFPGSYWIAAEINEIRENFKGHCYLELVEKDPEKDSIIARAKATVWAFTWRILKPYFETSTARTLEKGMTVLVEISVEFHELYGLSLNIKDIDPVYTIGDIERKRAETIRRLEREGIIEMNKSLAFPLFPSRIAVISSPDAAGYEDFMHQIKNNPAKYRFDITLFPALMQGDNAAISITEALDAIFEEEAFYDIVVILRGGGSASDLSCFDNYEIASHIAQFPLPVITGIGHERDRTIAGLVAHTDLKTPTAVAEFLIGKYQALDQLSVRFSARLATLVFNIIEQKRHLITNITKELPYLTRGHLRQKRHRINSAGSRIAGSASVFLQKNRYNLNLKSFSYRFITEKFLSGKKNIVSDFQNRYLPDSSRKAFKSRKDRLSLYNTTIGLVDPCNLLKKGYAIVVRNGIPVKSIKQIENEDILETKLHDGRIVSKVLGTDQTVE